MRTHEHQQFVERFTQTLEEKGKHPDYIKEQIKTLEMQLKYQHSIGADTSNFGGGAEHYANTVARDLPKATDAVKPVWMVVVFILGILSVPQFLNGTFPLSLGYGLFLLLVAGLSGFGLLAVLKFVEVSFVDYSRNHVSMVGYLIIFGYIMLVIAALIYIEGVLRDMPLFTFTELSNDVSFIVGWVLLALLVILFFVMRYWIFGVLLVVFSVAPVIYRQLTGAAVDGDNYLILSNVVFQMAIMLGVVIIGVSVWMMSLKRA